MRVSGARLRVNPRSVELFFAWPGMGAIETGHLADVFPEMRRGKLQFDALDQTALEDWSIWRSAILT